MRDPRIPADRKVLAGEFREVIRSLTAFRDRHDLDVPIDAHQRGVRTYKIADSIDLAFDHLDSVTRGLEEEAPYDDERGTHACRHCGRSIANESGVWVDPEATGDDGVWRETCDSHDTFTAEHEPVADCTECGEAMFTTDTGVNHHGTPDEIDHDADGDHVALTPDT